MQEASVDVRRLMTSANESRDAAEKEREKANQELTTMLLTKQALEADITVLRSQLARERADKDLAVNEARTLRAETEKLKKEVEAAHDSLLSADDMRRNLVAELEDTKELAENAAMNVVYTIWSQYRDLDFEFLGEGTNQKLLEIDAEFRESGDAAVVDGAAEGQVGGAAEIVGDQAVEEMQGGAAGEAGKGAPEEAGGNAAAEVAGETAATP